MPQAFRVESAQLVAEIAAVGDDLANVLVGEAVGSTQGVHPARDLVEVFAGDEAHDVVERAFAKFVFEDEAQVLRGFEGTALPHDLRNGGTVAEVEGLDDDTLGDGQAAPLHLFSASIGGDGAE